MFAFRYALSIIFIENDIVIRKILVYLDLWEIRRHDPPWLDPNAFHDFIIDESYCQMPPPDGWPI